MVVTSCAVPAPDNAHLSCLGNTPCLSCHVSGPLSSRWVNARIQFFQVGFPHEYIVISLSGLRKFTPSTSASISHESAGGGHPSCSRKITVRNVSLHEITENIRISRTRSVQLFLKPWEYRSRLRRTMYWLSLRQCVPLNCCGSVTSSARFPFVYL